MRPTTKETNQNPKARRQKKKQANEETKPRPKAKRSKKKDPRKQAKEELNSNNPTARHTTNWVPVPLNRGVQ
jgi:hypothetical protein